MSEKLSEQVDTMLKSVENELDDSDLIFKIRAARQLVLVYDEYLREHRDALDESDLDEEALEHLQKLGYLD